jgi:hypothetical protein
MRIIILACVLHAVYFLKYQIYVRRVETKTRFCEEI